MNLTTSGLTRLALQLSAVLAVVSASLTAWWMSRFRAR
jgi:ABC-type sulfate transport system permease component